MDLTFKTILDKLYISYISFPPPKNIKYIPSSVYICEFYKHVAKILNTSTANLILKDSVQYKTNKIEDNTLVLTDELIIKFIETN
jgi:hypothetical protein